MKRFYSLCSVLLLLSCDIIPAGNTIYRPNSSNNTGLSNNEHNEFALLIEKDLVNKKKVNAEVLTHLLNDADPEEKITAAVIENSSRCDIILRLVGVSNNRIYNLPIPRNAKNQFIIDKGSYTMKSTICGANYYAQKSIIEPLILKLSNN